MNPESFDAPGALPLGIPSSPYGSNASSTTPSSPSSHGNGRRERVLAADGSIPHSSHHHSHSERLEKMLDANARFVDTKAYMTHNTDKTRHSIGSRCVVVTCMDTRLTTLLPAALNIRPGDAKIIKNAGAIITHPFGGIMRSVIVALYELKADEVFVVAHQDCGMNNISTPTTIHNMIDKGRIPVETLRTLQYAGIDLHRWLHGFDSVQESVRTSVDIIRNHPLVPRHVPVHGLIIDPHTGKLEMVVDGSQLATPIPGEI